ADPVSVVACVLCYLLSVEVAHVRCPFGIGMEWTGLEWNGPRVDPLRTHRLLLRRMCSLAVNGTPHAPPDVARQAFQRSQLTQGGSVYQVTACLYSAAPADMACTHVQYTLS